MGPLHPKMPLRLHLLFTAGAPLALCSGHTLFQGCDVFQNHVFDAHLSWGEEFDAIGIQFFTQRFSFADDARQDGHPGHPQCRNVVAI